MGNENKKKLTPQEQRLECVQDMWWENKQCVHPNIDYIQVHNTNVPIGGKHRKTYKPFVERVLEDNFTPKEMSKVKNLYIETHPDVAFTLGGQLCRYEHKGVIGGVIEIPHKSQGDDVLGGEDSLTHENVHALRDVTGRFVEDHDHEEAKTVLETIARISKDGLEKNDSGYYKFVPGCDTTDKRFEAMDADRLLLNQTMDFKRKGDDAIRTVEKKFPKSNISRVKITSEVYPEIENLHRYFSVETRKGVNIRIHKHYKKGKSPSTASIKKRLQRKHGKNATIWEWHDGKKVKIASSNSRKKVQKGNGNKTYENAMKNYRREMKKIKLF